MAEYCEFRFNFVSSTPGLVERVEKNVHLFHVHSIDTTKVLPNGSVTSAFFFGLVAGLYNMEYLEYDTSDHPQKRE